MNATLYARVRDDDVFESPLCVVSGVSQDAYSYVRQYARSDDRDSLDLAPR